MDIIRKLFDRLEIVCHGIGLAAIFIMMITITVDTMGRYFLNSPITGSFELVQNYLLVAAVFLSVSYTYKIDSHIKIELFTRFIPEKVRAVLFIITGALAIVLFSVITYENWLKTWEALIRNETLVGVVAWPTFLSYVWIPLGMGLLTLRILLMIIESISFLFKKDLKNMNMIGD